MGLLWTTAADFPDQLGLHNIATIVFITGDSKGVRSPSPALGRGEPTTGDRVRVLFAGSEYLLQCDGVALIQDNGIGASFEIDLEIPGQMVAVV